MRGINKLSAAKVAKTTKPGRYGDGGGLWLNVTNTGTKSWIFRYMLDGKVRQMGLGSVNDRSLVRARQRAQEYRELLLDKIDPLTHRNAQHRAQRLEETRTVTFRACAEEYIRDNKAAWKNAKHASQWQNTLSAYAYPIIGDLSVASIDTNLVLKVLRPIWQDKPETARRVRGRIEAILSYATVSEYRAGDNPARWRGHLSEVLPKVGKVKHHTALPYADLPALMMDLRFNDSVSARALEFTILCAARTGEVIGAKWPEIDLDAKVWTIPAERMKSSREHRVALSERAVEILQSLPRESDFVFPGGRKGKGLSNMAMLELLKGMTSNGLTVHGFRSTFRDWCAEQTSYANEVAEMALAHVVGDKVEAAYRRGDMFERRARLMHDWARYCETPTPASDNVVTIKGQAS